MSAAISRCEETEAGRWSDGAVEIGVARIGRETRLAHLYQSDSCRALFPRPGAGGPFEAVVVTTSGGLVGGDRLRVAIDAGVGSATCVTTQAAEKVYRSAGATTEVHVDIAVGSGGALEWMPQETILFDRARLRRETRIGVEAGSRVLAGDLVVFGRIARGEAFASGLLHDAWRVRRGGELVWADALHLDGAIGDRLAGEMTFGGAVAMATFLVVADDAAGRLDDVRALLGEVETKAGIAAATCIGTVLVIRCLSRDAAELRARYAGLWSGIRESILGFPGPLPRVWEN